MHSMFLAIVVLCASAKDGAAHSAILAHFEALQSMEVRYLVVNEFNPLVSPEEARKQGVVLKTGNEKYRCSFRFLHGKARYETQLLSKPPDLGVPVVFPEREVKSFTAERVEEMTYRGGEESPLGSISNPGSARPAEYDIDVALGLRGYREAVWLRTDEFANMPITWGDGGVVWVESQGSGTWQHRWRFDPEAGYALTRYEMMGTRQPYVGKVFFEMVADDFLLSDGVRLPQKIEMRVISYTSAGERRVVETRRVEVEGYSLNPPDNNDRAFSIEWPLGAKVLDDRSGEVLEITSRPRVLDDETIARAQSIWPRLSHFNCPHAPLSLAAHPAQNPAPEPRP